MTNSDPLDRTRSLFQVLYKQLVQTHSTDPGTGEIRPKGYPGVVLTPKGDLFGPYSQVKSYLQQKEVSRFIRERGDEPVVVHHLLENRQMKHYGIKREDGICVAIFRSAHSHKDRSSIHVSSTRAHEEGLPSPSTFTLPQREKGKEVVVDIKDIVEDATERYEELRRPEWASRVVEFVRENEQKIARAQNTSSTPLVSGSTSRSRSSRIHQPSSGTSASTEAATSTPQTSSSQGKRAGPRSLFQSISSKLSGGQEAQRIVERAKSGEQGQ